MASQRALNAKAARIRLLLFDVDGVLTDGSLALHTDGTESKRFHIRDGAGVVLAHRAGLLVGFLSARPSAATSRRAKQLAVRIVAQHRHGKLEAYGQIVRRHRLTDAQVAYMGDDLLDLPVLARVGLSAAPADAAADVMARVDLVTRARGGEGAARELIELVLKAQKHWPGILAAHGAPIR